jgi:putative membrane protein
MLQSAITAYLHYLGFMLAFGALAIEAYTIKKDLSVEEAWRLVIADSVYGISITVVLITGILRVMYFGKGLDYYLNNHVFYTKMGIFILVSLFSLYPTFSFISWIKNLRDRQVPNLEISQVQKLSWLIRGELMGLILIPLFAALLARGF